jgi:hypothetical protein
MSLSACGHRARAPSLMCPHPNASRHSYIILSPAMLLIEALLVLEDVKIPTWVLPYNTAYEVICLLHRLFPAYMNVSRCILGAYHVDPAAVRLEQLQQLLDVVKVTSNKIGTSAQLLALKCKDASTSLIKATQGDDSASGGLMGAALAVVTKRTRYALSETVGNQVDERIRTQVLRIQDPRKLSESTDTQSSPSRFALELLRNLVIFLALRFIFVK